MRAGRGRRQKRRTNNDEMSEDLNDSGLSDKGAGSAAECYFEFRGVNKAFDEHVVLQNVSFKVKRGDTCVIMGRSGVGKSVSLKHILGFLKADSGKVLIDGVDVTHFTERQFEQIRRKVTMVFQSGALFDSLSVSENTKQKIWKPEVRGEFERLKLQLRRSLRLKP